MSEWWTYTLSDFLLFAPRTYYRLFELYNAAIWPGQGVAISGGVLIVVSLWVSRPWSGRMIAAILAAGWLWVAYGWFFTRYASINWAATWFGVAFVIEGLLLFLSGVVGNRLAPRTESSWITWCGLGIFLFALVAQPLLGMPFGRAVSQAEIFGLAPDPTAEGTMGLLLLTKGGTRWGLLLIPLLWGAITGATLWTMQASDAWISPIVAAIVLSAAVVQAIRRRASNA